MKIVETITLPSGNTINRVRKDNGIIETKVPAHLAKEYSAFAWKRGIEAGKRLGILKETA